MAEDLKYYRVSLAGDAEGKSAAVVAVPKRHPYQKTIRKHVERVVETLDGRKRLDYPLERVQHDMSALCEEEMQADAVRAFNATNSSSHSAKQLAIEPVEAPANKSSSPSGPRGVRVRQRDAAPESLESSVATGPSVASVDS